MAKQTSQMMTRRGVIQRAKLHDWGDWKNISYIATQTGTGTERGDSDGDGDGDGDGEGTCMCVLA